MKSLTILGATGSIGRSTLDIVAHHPDRFRVGTVASGRDVEGLAAAARECRASRAVIADESRLAALREALDGSGCEVAAGREAMLAAAAGEADCVVAAIVGCAGLEPVMAAVEAGRTVALANKEALVTAGTLMTAAARRSGSVILPVDSEHNAIFQCLAGNRSSDVAKLILTASGGPFRSWDKARMDGATRDAALAHPNWSMGAKISIDSATMMNKGLELIEAHHLFDLPEERIEILVHPQSVIHSMVEYVDGSVIAQLGAPDMRVPIAFALSWPERIATPAERLDLARIGSLTFEAPDETRFPALRLARQALRDSGAAPIVLNAANEVAVAAFLDGRIRFGDIAALVERALDQAGASAPQSVAEVIDIDRATRDKVGSYLASVTA